MLPSSTAKLPTSRITAWTIAIILFGLLIGQLSAQTKRLVADEKRCPELSSSQQSWLSDDWKPFLPYARVCPVQSTRHKPVLLVISVWAPLYYRAQPGSSVPQTEMPHPLLFSPSGAKRGTLPYNFPDDPPASLRVAFSEWRHDFPQRIDLYLTDPRASGDRALPPLHWNPQAKQFVAHQEGGS